MIFGLARLRWSPTALRAPAPLLWSLPLALACAKPAAPREVEVARPSSVPTATREPARNAEAATALATPGPPLPATTESPSPAALIAEAERELYQIIMRLAREPGARAELASNAKLVFHGSRESRRPLKDAHAELAWLADGHVPLVAANESAAELDSSMICDPAALRCVVSEPGGETIFKFRRKGRSVQLIEVEGSD